ncbi:MAG: Fe-S protein assembly co-chaperone HscB [Deltaproteobacteria bacterium]|nr:Fe-S protein assembly co-chaperone HscB [Deltaproteobacteria bacterium]
MSNHFELFGLQKAFELDAKALDARYRELSQQWHPDKQTSGDAKQRLQALEMSAHLNQAYKTLRDASARAAYLLKLLGLDLDQEGERTFQMNPAFLAEMLELREELDAAKNKNDVQRALAMGKQMQEREKETHAKLAELFAQQLASPEHARLQKLGDQVAALRYYRRFLDEVSAIEDEATQV